MSMSFKMLPPYAKKNSGPTSVMVDHLERCIGHMNQVLQVVK